MTRLIIESKGTLDKFIGDAIMAFWNAPLNVPDHPRLAVETGLAMLRELDILNEGFRERYGFEIQIGIGLHRGPVRVGNFGSADLFDYTIIGDNVNLGSRLEGLTKYYHQRLLVTGAMREGAGEGWAWREVDRVRVKGKFEPVTIHAVWIAEFEHLASRWDEALALYRQGRFVEAREVFTDLAAAGDELSELYAGRCGILEANPPAEGWDGVFEHTTK